jgi:hypothetical protein
MRENEYRTKEVHEEQTLVKKCTLSPTIALTVSLLSSSRNYKPLRHGSCTHVSTYIYIYIHNNTIYIIHCPRIFSWATMRLFLRDLTMQSSWSRLRIGLSKWLHTKNYNISYKNIKGIILNVLYFYTFIRNP